MRYSTLSTILAGIAAVSATDGPAKAEVVTGNPKATYVAALQPGGTSKVQGSIIAQEGAGGLGVKYTIQLSGLEKTETLPYLYHVHAKAIQAGGKCADAAGHLTQGPTALNWNCNLKYASNDFTDKPDLCEIGQLSSKYGNITADKIDGSGKFALEVTDNFSSLKPGEKNYIGDKSVVIHNGKNDRLVCANFQKSG